jgi:hypothetical protein
MLQDNSPPIIQERVGRCLVAHNPCTDQAPLLESCSVSIPRSFFNPKTNRNVRSFILTLEVSIPLVETTKKKKRKKSDAKPEQKRKFRRQPKLNRDPQTKFGIALCSLVC